MLFIFGPLRDSWIDSWILGNDFFTTYRNIHPGLAKDFDNGTLSASNIDWGSVGMLGEQPLCFFAMKNGQTYSTQIANLTADISNQAIEHLTFSAGGGWFVRYRNGTVRLSMAGDFPNSFHQLAKGHMVTRGPGASVQQYSDIQNVFFGSGNTILIQLTNGGLMWEDLPDGLEEQLRSKHTEGFIVSSGSCLSPMGKPYYAIQWKKRYDWNLVPNQPWAYSIPHHAGILTVLLIRETIEENGYPTSLNMSEKTEDYNIPEELRVTCRETFKAIAGTKDYVTGDEFKLIMSQVLQTTKQKFDNASLGKLWDLSDINSDGKLTLDEYTLAFGLIRRYKGSFPDKVPIRVLQELRLLKDPTPRISRVASIGLKQNDEQNLSDELDALDLSKQENEAVKNPSRKTPFKEPPTEPYRDPGNGDQKGESFSRSANDKQLRESLHSSIVKENPNIQWDDVAGLDAAKEELQEAVIMPIKYPNLFRGKRKPRQGILLYGPPGTGKSYLAKAVATEVDSTLFSISSSDVMSKWYGESEALVKTLFEMARENKPSIIFIDEIDALCGNRDSADSNEHTARMKTELMVQIDGVGNDNTGVLLLAATNLPWTLDPAMRRRFQRRIHIALPNEEARRQMFKIHVGDTPCGLTEKDYIELARKTVGLSGSDISNAVQDALMQPVKKISSSKYWQKISIDGKNKWTPCTPNARGAVQMNWRKVPASDLHEPTIEAQDFFDILVKVKPSVNEIEIVKCAKWTDEFGLEGA